MKQFTKKQFKQWIESKDEKAIIGMPRSACSCPIASFLSETQNLKGANVDNWTVSYDKKRFPLKHWQINFIDGIDEYGANLIRKKQALDVLSKV